MKKWTGLLFSLVALILIAYFIMGFIAERSLNKNVNAFPKTSILNVHLDKYHRGWFSSQAILGLTLHIPEQQSTDKNGQPRTNPPADVELGFPLIINHGPIICTDNGLRFGIAHVTTRPQTHYQALVDYFNQTRFTYTFPSFDINAKVGTDNAQIKFQGIKALLSISPNIDKLDGNLIVYGASGFIDNITFGLGEVSSDFKFARNQDGLWLGKTTLSVPSFTINEGSSVKTELKNFDIGISSDINGGVLNFSLNASLEKLQLDDKNYGPGILKLRITNLDPKAMAQINQIEATMLQENQDPKIPMLALLTELPKLLSKGAELNLSELSLGLPEGKITGNLKLSLPPSETGDANQLVQKTHGEGQFRAPIAVVRELLVSSIKDDLTTEAEKKAQAQSTPESVANPATLTAPNFDEEAQKQADKLLQDYTNKGLLKTEGDSYVIVFTLENQKVTVNGQPFDPNTLQ